MDLAQATPWVDVIGVDVAKSWIDSHRLPPGQPERVPATRLEASVGYERPRLDALARAGVAHRVVNPRQARDFARATGRRAKTDRVDARVLAGTGRTLALTPSPPPGPERERPAALLARREGLVAMARAEATRLAQAATADLRREITSRLRVFKAHLLLVERQMADSMADSAPLAPAAARLSTVKSIGPIAAAALLARLPELGRLDRRIAAPGLPRSAGLRLRPATPGCAVANATFGAGAPISGAPSTSPPSPPRVMTSPFARSEAASQPRASPARSSSPPAPASSCPSSRP